MKKLLVLAAIIVAGIAANAASFKWTASNIYSPADSTTKLSGATVTLYAYLSTADISTATAVATASTTAAGAVSKTFDADLSVGSDYNFYFVIESGDKAFTSTTKANIAAQATSTSNIAFGSMASATQNASNWAAVPEPTSGLLMLLGLAGLALKRKRA